MIELTFLKVLMLIRTAHQKSVFLVTIGIFLIKALGFKKLFAMIVMIY